MQKTVKSNDNVHTRLNFNDCLTSGQLHYNWGKITVIRLNHFNAHFTPSSTGHTATSTALLAI